MATRKFENFIQDKLEVKSLDFESREDRGTVPDCSDGHSCNTDWIGDSWCDGTDQPYGCDLTCYINNDGGDCDVCGDGVCGYWENFNGFCDEDCEVATCESLNQTTCPDASCAAYLEACPIYECTDYTITAGDGFWQQEISWLLTAPTGNGIQGGAPYTNNDICLPNGYYTLSMWDSSADGWNENNFKITKDSGEEIIILTLPLDNVEGEENFCLGDSCCLGNSAAGDVCHQALYDLDLNFANADYAAIHSPFGNLTPNDEIDTADPVIMIKLANTIPIIGYQFEFLIDPGVEIVGVPLIDGGEDEFEIFMQSGFIQVIGPIKPCTNTLDLSCHTLLLALPNEMASQYNNQVTVTIKNFKVFGDIPELGFTQEELAACDINHSQNCRAEDIFYTPNANCNQDTWREFWPSGLMGCQLTDLSFEEANFTEANLTNANLQGSFLLGANFEGADLTDGLLLNAMLRDADFTGANIPGANLTDANLQGANFQRTTLTSANLQGALICGAIGLTPEQIFSTIGVPLTEYDKCGECGGDNSSCDEGCGPNQPAALSYCEDTDSDGLGAGDSTNYCLDNVPDGWVSNCSDSEPDCATNNTDSCGVCAGSGIPDDACDCEGNVLDCAGKCDGAATTDNCDTCDADSSNDCVQDCAETWGGAAELDCNNECGGSAVVDNCDECVGGNTGESACVQDCNGDWGGSAVLSGCDNVCNSTAVLDDCGVCGGTAEVCQISLSIEIASGWNWFSLNVEDGDMSIDTVMGSLNNSTAEDFIKNQTASAIFYDGGTGWFGGLQVLSPNEGYMLNVAAASTHNYPNFEPDDARDEFLTDLDDGIF